LAFYGPFAFVPAGTQHVIAKVGFIGFALFLRVFHPTVGVQAIDSLTWQSTDLTIAGTQQRSWPVEKRVRPTPVRTGTPPTVPLRQAAETPADL
jgi:hypothetical protein